MKRCSNSDLGRAWEAKLAGSNLKLLCFASYGMRDFYTVQSADPSPGGCDQPPRSAMQPLPVYTEMVPCDGVRRRRYRGRRSTAHWRRA